MNNDYHYIKFAINIARKNIGYSYPKPTVGCIIVKNNIIIAKAVTHYQGKHAEKIAIDSCNEDLTNATLYSTLEPCCHYGQTSPCTDYIIKSGIKRVVIAIQDPFSKVSGKGVKILKDNGIEVIKNICVDEALELHYGFLKAKIDKLPQITVKVAQTIDSKIATENFESKWITNKQARIYAHKLRSNNEAIMVGKKTFIKDLPRLDCRLEGIKRQPIIRIIADRKLSSIQHIIKQDMDIKTIILADSNCNKNKSINYKNLKNIEIINSTDIKEAMNIIASMGIHNILVEGGGKLISSLIHHNLIDNFISIRSPKIIGNTGISSICNLEYSNLSDAPEMKINKIFTIDDNIVEYYISKQKTLTIEKYKKYLH